MNSSSGHPDFDVIIVGAGAAGCVLAGRLSEASDKQVLLLEAGPDALPGQEHADIRDSFPVSLGNPRFMWQDLIAEVGADLGDGRPRGAKTFVQGFGVGGGSNVQGMFAVRGLPEDYDEWRDLGAAGWSWQEVLPYFNKLERDLDFSGPLHGTSGPIPIRRNPAGSWPPFSNAVGAAIARRGYRSFEDYNGDFGEGLSSMPMANLADQRVSASMGYLPALVRRRPNLTIVPNATVERLEIQDKCIRGVLARTVSGTRRFFGKDTVLSSGALRTPALLLSSGIGPAEHLQGVGVTVVRDLPGVGRNLQNHPKVQDIAVHLPRSSMQPRRQHTLGQNCLRYSSHAEGCAPKDMFITSLNKASWHPLGKRIGIIAVVVHKPYSKGYVELAGADPSKAPRICFNTLSDERDFVRLVGGLRSVLQLLLDPEVAAVRNEAFLPQGKIVAKLAKRSASAWFQAFGIKSLFDIPPLRRELLKDLTLNIAELIGDEAALRALVRQRVELSRHVCGTCKMGRADDSQSVVDSRGRVHGVNGLRVVDASIFPTLMRANTHLPVLMVAEKMADHIKADWLETRRPRPLRGTRGPERQMMKQLRATLAVESRDQLGEGPVWDASQQRLLWQDHGSGIIREARADGAGWRETRRWNLNRAIAASIPRRRGGLVVPGGMEIFLMDDAGALSSFVHLDAESELARINDAKCDARGRLWAGTLTSNFQSGGGALYRIDPDGTVKTILRGVTLANGLDWSPDGTMFYFVDSFTRSVDAFDFDAHRGEISNRRKLVTLKSGVPNGITVDREGNVWVAATGGGNVQCYAPSGELLSCIEIGTPGATSCAFGGPDCAHLFITSRAGRMPDAAKEMGVDPKMMDNNGPEAGGLFVCQPGAHGTPANAFAG